MGQDPAAQPRTLSQPRYVNKINGGRRDFLRGKHLGKPVQPSVRHRDAGKVSFGMTLRLRACHRVKNSSLAHIWESYKSQFHLFVRPFELRGVVAAISIPQNN
jgi:hypothetical protein